MPRAACLILLAFGLGVRLAQAQNPQPLRKTDLIRLLTSGSLSKRDIAAQVRRNCLSFTPSPRDRTDLVASGADSGVLSAVSQCARPTGTLRVLAPAQLRAVTGSEVTVEARLLRYDVPQPGVTLVLRGAGALLGGSGHDPAAVTDSTGRATLRFLAGMQPGTYQLQITPTGGAAALHVNVELTTTPATAVRVDIQPAVVAVREASRGGAAVQVTVTDDRGRPVPGLRLSLEGITAELGVPIAPVTTDSAGTASIVIPAPAVRRGGQVGLLVGGTRIAVFTVLIEAVVLHPDRTQFVGGVQQRGVVAKPLSSALVFQVRDSAGGVVAGYPVTFTTSSGTVTPAATVTDAGGQARTQVALGERAGPVTIAAHAGRVTKQVTVFALPGEPEILVAERAGTAVGRLSLTTRDSVALRVVTRDHFGNKAVQSNLTAQMFGGAATLRETRSSAAGTVVLTPRKNGTATLSLQASGLVTTVPIQVSLPAAERGWIFDARVGGAAFNYGFKSIPGVSGHPGFRGEITGGRLFGPALRVQAGIGLGMLRADSPVGNVSVGLFQGLVRGEYALIRGGNLVPVVSLGGGMYRIKSTDPRTMVYHTSLFWMIGAGVDYALGFRLTGTARLERQQLLEASSQYANGAVGALTVLEIGVRLTP